MIQNIDSKNNCGLVVDEQSMIVHNLFAEFVREFNLRMQIRGGTLIDLHSTKDLSELPAATYRFACLLRVRYFEALVRSSIAAVNQPPTDLVEALKEAQGRFLGTKQI